MAFLASNNVIAGKKILALIKSENFWIAISDEENREDFELNADHFAFVDEAYMTSRIPKLIGQLDQPDGTIINIDYDTGEINFNKKHFHFGIPTHGARASRQANTEFSLFRWLKNNASKYKVWFIWIVVLLVLSKWIGWFFYIPIVIIIVLRYLMDSKERDMYYSGALVPGVVVDENKGLIAVLTDLTKGSGSYPLLKIQKVIIPKSHRKNQTKLAIAGTYQETEGYPHWNFFDPLVLISGMKYPEKHPDKIKEIPNIEWIQLFNEVKKREDNLAPGWYPLQIETSDWKNIDIEKIDWVN